MCMCECVGVCQGDDHYEVSACPVYRAPTMKRQHIWHKRQAHNYRHDKEERGSAESRCIDVRGVVLTRPWYNVIERACGSPVPCFHASKRKLFASASMHHAPPFRISKIFVLMCGWFGSFLHAYADTIKFPASSSVHQSMTVDHPPSSSPSTSLHATRLEDHLVWPVAAPEAECGREVRKEERLLLETSQQGLVDGLLVLYAGTRGLLGLNYCQYLCMYIMSVELT